MNKTLDENENPILQTISEPLQQLLNQRARERRSGKEKPSDKTVRYRPTRRPPMAFVTIIDDGSDADGELLRVRTTDFTFGRSEGDVTIPFDPDMSASHAALECRHQRGEYQWFLADRNSKNGTFLRAYKARPRDGAEIVIGGRHYEFQTGRRSANPVKANPDQTITYRKPSGHELYSGVPRLIEITGTADRGEELTLGADAVTLGHSCDCDVRILNDRLVSAVHAKFSRDKQNRWVVEDQKSVNGIWIRVNRIALAHQAEFQLGQQRFLFEVR